MAEDKVRYKRLPGRGASLLEYHHLYLGPDHLLKVSSMWGQESYKRFYYRDIQAVVIRQTPLGDIATAFWAFLTVLFLALTLAATGTAQIVLGSFAGLFLLALLIHLAMGRTVKTILRTAVQVEPMPSLYRLPTARQVMRRLQPLIEEAQRDLAPRFAPAPEAGAQAPAEPGTESALPS